MLLIKAVLEVSSMILQNVLVKFLLRFYKFSKLLSSAVGFWRGSSKLSYKNLNRKNCVQKSGWKKKKKYCWNWKPGTYK